ncbi:hypothetical protein M231_00963 [Tremella mesenterica]|uniref:DUF427 domain-containing protein n=1 Tax=Tremella mesenterica TaxID=5217 RepID=A0A4Q1BUM0_TREME|nr:uncharacterized protein TREMEDRAFT_61634 [Tremella mesenterica DSM 1558]EIW69863.1 hypothetical protein TREMEDRAFT_61634 [Tremella mesenterica DSM 1558]RXK41728.1 hypothetical protein M231_00963 [Tremella mesenterica]
MSPQITVSLGEEILASAPKDQTETVEGNYYFKEEAVKDKSKFKPSKTESTCPWKGLAKYYDYVNSDGKVYKDLVWYYPNPKKGAEMVDGRWAFYKSKHPDLHIS